MIEFTINGQCLAKTRPRFTKEGRAYDDQKSEKAVMQWKIRAALSQYVENQLIFPLYQTIFLDVTFYMPIPISFSKEKINHILENESYHNKKPDLDNLLKFLLDAGNGLLWNDDAQIVKISAQKKYSETPRTKIKIELA